MIKSRWSGLRIFATLACSLAVLIAIVAIFLVIGKPSTNNNVNLFSPPSGEQIAESLWDGAVFYLADADEEHSIYSLAESGYNFGHFIPSYPDAYTIYDDNGDGNEDVILLCYEGGYVVYEARGKYYAYSIDNYTLGGYATEWSYLNWE